MTITSHPDNPIAPDQALSKVGEGEQIPTLQWTMDRLGVSKHRVMSLVKRGRLSPPQFLSRPGDHVSLLVFDAHEVMALRSKIVPIVTRPYVKKYRGTPLVNWSKVFRALRDGMSFEEIVIAFNLSPGDVRRIKREYDSGFAAGAGARNARDPRR